MDGVVDRVVGAVRHASASAPASCVVSTSGRCVSVGVVRCRRCVHVLVDCSWESVSMERGKKGDIYQLNCAIRPWH